MGSARSGIFVLVAVTPTLACGALFGVNFGDVPSPDSGPVEGSVADAGTFCQTHPSHMFCWDFDEDVMVPTTPVAWTANVLYGSARLTTDASVSPPASFDSRVWDGDVPLTFSAAALTSPQFPIVSEVHYEADVRIVSCADDVGFFLSASTESKSETGWAYDPSALSLFFFYTSPYADAGGGISSSGGSAERIPVASVGLGTWLHLTAEVWFSPNGGATEYEVSTTSVNDAGPEAGLPQTVRGAGLFEPKNNALTVQVGLQATTPCEVELDNYTLDYTMAE
jgi:hypothetical protein